jgi:hypothetical protein
MLIAIALTTQSARVAAVKIVRGLLCRQRGGGKLGEIAPLCQKDHDE